MILWLLLLVVVTWVVNFRIKRRRLYELASLIPKIPEELPLIGVAHKLSGNTEDIMNKLKEYSYLAMQHDGIVRGWLGPKLYCVMTNPVDLEMVLKTCLEKDDLHVFLRKVTGQGSIFAPVSVWRSRRKFTVPVFSPKNLENFVPIFSESSEKLTKTLISQANGGPFRAWHFLTCFTLTSVCETTMGVSLNAQEDLESSFLNSINRVLNLVCERIFHLWLQPDWIFKLFRKYQEHKKCLHNIQSFVEKVIEKRRAELENGNNGSSKADNYVDDNKKSLLDLLIFAVAGEKEWTNIELRDEVITFVIAGTDTSAIAIGNVLKMLAKYPEVQEKIVEEIHQVYGDSDRALVKEDLIKLKYLEQVIKETLRLYPPVPLIARKVLEELKLPSGRVLPAGAGVVCSIIGAHRDPKYWGSKAENFDPDRFLPENFNLAHACSFMPFSNGPRNCVGYQYAKMSVKIALVAILRKFKVVEDRDEGPIPCIRVKFDILMKAVDDFEIGLKRRDVVLKK